MSDSTKPKTVRTLRGAIGGEDLREAIYFGYSAMLRIHGHGLPFELINKQLGIQPTHTHCKGDRQGLKSPPFSDDAWHYRPKLPKTLPLAEHINALWEVLKPHIQYLKSLKQQYKVDVFCGYRSNCDHAGFEVPHSSLELFTALEVPFGVSIIIA